MKLSVISKSQWIGAAILVGMVVAVIVFVHIVPQREVTPDLSSVDSVLIDSVSKRRKPYYRHKKYSYPRDTIALCLQPFDPNTADSMTLLQVGLRPWQIRNMLKYRAKNGRWRKKEDLKRLYGMNDSLYAMLEPYICIDTVTFSTCEREVDTVATTKRDTVIELNSADIATLQRIRGIGRGVALRIVKYRNDLGGFVSPEQVREIDKLQQMDRDSTIYFWLDSIIPYLTADSNSIRKIKVNQTSLDRLVRHPYLTYPQAEVIYKRMLSRKIRSIDDLRGLPELPDSVLTKIAPYLDFSPRKRDR
ncbi:MAG: helix-hairpin-helix domain-containing protein [Paludibacteraceae bacterium]|nr:helix-hairpin-helix domain-containing protein [Paludibacteraceae bacterium]